MALGSLKCTLVCQVPKVFTAGWVLSLAGGGAGLAILSSLGSHTISHSFLSCLAYIFRLGGACLCKVWVTEGKY